MRGRIGVIADLARRGVGVGAAINLADYLERTRGNWCRCWAIINAALPSMPPWEVTRFLHGHGYHPVPYSASIQS